MTEQPYGHQLMSVQAWQFRQTITKKARLCNSIVQRLLPRMEGIHVHPARKSGFIGTNTLPPSLPCSATPCSLLWSVVNAVVTRQVAASGLFSGYSAQAGLRAQLSSIRSSCISPDDVQPSWNAPAWTSKTQWLGPGSCRRQRFACFC